MGRSKHAPNRLRPYIEIHDSFISRYTNRSFIGFNTLEFLDFPSNILLKGHLGCSGNIVISVQKLLVLINDDDLVQTKWYAYNVSVQNIGNIFRYDNQDKDFSFREGHKDPHHKHIFDWKHDIEKNDSPIWIGSNGWPTLGEVIEETYQWYWDNYTELGQDYPNQESLYLS